MAGLKKKDNYDVANKTSQGKAIRIAALMHEKIVDSCFMLFIRGMYGLKSGIQNLCTCRANASKRNESKCLRSALYARNPVSILIRNRMDAVHKAQHVGIRGDFSVQNLDAFTVSVHDKIEMHLPIHGNIIFCFSQVDIKKAG